MVSLEGTKEGVSGSDPIQGETCKISMRFMFNKLDTNCRFRNSAIHRHPTDTPTFRRTFRQNGIRGRSCH